MAAIFFDGFNANRPINNAYYGVEPNFGANWPAQRIYGSTVKKRNASAPNAGALQLVAIGSRNATDGGGIVQSLQNVGPALRCGFGTQTGKKLFFGVAVSGLQLHPYAGFYVDGTLSGTEIAPEHSAGNTPANLEHAFLRLYSANGLQQLAITLSSYNSSSAVLQLGLTNYSADKFSVPLDYVGTFASESFNLPTGTGGTLSQQAYVVRNAPAGDFNYFEFALDMTNPAATTFECRINDQPLRLLTSPETEVITLDNPLTDVASLVLLPGISADMFYDDLYIADNTGATVNDFLGRETAVYSPNLTAATETAWDIISDQTPADPTLNTVDDENYLTTGAFDQVSTFSGAISPGATALVGAVMLTSYAKKTSLDAKYEHVFKPSGGAVQAIGTPKSVTNLSFNCPDNAICAVPNTTILPTNPATSAAWTVTDVNSAEFGVKSLDPAV